MLLAALLAAACGGGGSDDVEPPATPTAARPTAAAPTAAPSTPPSRSVLPPVPSPSAPTGPGPIASRPARTPGFPARLAGRDVERIPTGERVIALTFDGGSDAGGVPALLATLARERVPATFFLTGRFVTAFPQSARRIAAAGHRLGDHSVSHPHFPLLTGARIRAEVLDAATTIRAGTGAEPAPLFRFPYGDRDPRTIAAVNSLGYLPVRWTVDSLGWQGTLGGTRDASFVTRRVLAAAGPGGIVLMHAGAHPTDRSTLDAAALPAIIAGLRQDGYRFVTLDAVLT